MSMHRTGVVVPHTHWDRAWYLPFQAYRLRLVEMVADLLDLLESNTLPNFVLDGQTVILEDHFAIRPQDRPRVRALVESGRLRLGPWYTMPDCFLARPESLIRNLQRGVSIAVEHGGASKIGYVPDSFGHFAELPQILAGFGIDSFLFMRGMPVEFRDRHGASSRGVHRTGRRCWPRFCAKDIFHSGPWGRRVFTGGTTACPPAMNGSERLRQTLCGSCRFRGTRSWCCPPAGIIFRLAATSPRWSMISMPASPTSGSGSAASRTTWPSFAGLRSRNGFPSTAATSSAKPIIRCCGTCSPRGSISRFSTTARSRCSPAWLNRWPPGRA